MEDEYDFLKCYGYGCHGCRYASYCPMMEKST